jgi:hypothetical protein
VLTDLFPQRGVPHRCAKPLPLQLDFVDDGYGPLLKDLRTSYLRRAETDCYFAIKRDFAPEGLSLRRAKARSREVGCAGCIPDTLLLRRGRRRREGPRSTAFEGQGPAALMRAELAPTESRPTCFRLAATQIPSQKLASASKQPESSNPPHAQAQSSNLSKRPTTPPESTGKLASEKGRRWLAARPAQPKTTHEIETT